MMHGGETVICWQCGNWVKMKNDGYTRRHKTPDGNASCEVYIHQLQRRTVYPQWLTDRLNDPAFNAWAGAFHRIPEGQWTVHIDLDIKKPAPTVLDGEDREMGWDF